MAYVPDHLHDIFVSYAHVDDEAMPGAGDGWVTTLIGCVKTRLSQLLGRRDAYSLWMDYELAKSVDLSEQIVEALERTATMLVVLSPGYTASEWCRREKDRFLRFAAEKGKSRVFIVERDKVAPEERPKEFEGLLGFRFWEQVRDGRAPRILGSPRPTAEDQKYYNRVDDLCHELAQTLQRLKSESGAAAIETAAPVDPDAPTVFLAEVTDDLDHERNSVKRYLRQAGINVLPRYSYSLEPATFSASASADLSESALFVQLLSAASGKKPADLPEGYVQRQIDLAGEAGVPMLQWRSPQLELESVEDQGHRAILEAATVRAERMEDFKREIVKQATPEEPAERPETPLNAFVFVDMETEDRPLADEVCQVLERYGADYMLPIQEADPASKRRDLEQNLLECDGVIVVYGSSTVAWVREQLRQARKILAVRETPLQAFAVFEGPPEEKEALDLKFRNMHVLNCRKGLDDAALMQFLDGLGAGGEGGPGSAPHPAPH